MNFKKIILSQGIQGLIMSIFVFISPEFVLGYLSPNGVVDTLSVQMLRVTSLFIIVLCLTLISVRDLKEKHIQKQVLISNMSIDLIFFIFLVFATYSNYLSTIGGYIFAGVFLMNAMSYLPAYTNLQKSQKRDLATG